MPKDPKPHANDPSGPLDPPMEVPVPYDFDNEPHGLFIVYQVPSPSGHAHPQPDAEIEYEFSTSDAIYPANYNCSIVAVHGLNGTAKQTWTDPESGCFWLEDFLPECLPKSRIMTFGYDSGLLLADPKQVSMNSLETYSTD